MNQQIKEWQEEFDRKFAATKETDAHYYNPWLTDVKDFIRANFHPKSASIDKEVLRNTLDSHLPIANVMKQMGQENAGIVVEETIRQLKESLGL